MARPRNIVPPSTVNITLPEDVRLKIDLFLWDTSTGRVPYGAYGKFVTELAKKHFEHVELDLSPYTGAIAGIQVVSGSEETIRVLREMLEGER